MNNDVYISTDKALLDINFIHQYIGKMSYWGAERTMEQTKKTIENSFCFGMYLKTNVQIGFARVVTDYVFFGYLMDVIIDNKYQGKGLGKALMEFILDHKAIKDLQTLALKTKDAHSLYDRYGFKKVGDSAMWMAMDKQKYS